MKKLLLLFIFTFVLVFSGCADKESPAYEPSDVPAYTIIDNTAEYNVNQSLSNVTITISNVTPTGATINIKDTNKEPYVYGEWYKIERKSGTTWVDADTVTDVYGFNDIGYLVDEKTNELTIETDWEWLYGALPSGQYRIYKQVGLGQCINVEFDIK